jgi:hypothetical protein
LRENCPHYLTQIAANLQLRRRAGCAAVAGLCNKFAVFFFAEHTGIAIIPIGIDLIPIGIRSKQTGNALISIDFASIPIDVGPFSIGIALIPVVNGAIHIGIGLIPTENGVIPIGIWLIPIDFGAIQGEGKRQATLHRHSADFFNGFSRCTHQSLRQYQ